MTELHDAIRRSPRPATPEALAIWAAEIWAMPEAQLTRLGEKFTAVVDDERASSAERRAASHLLDAVDLALADEMPSVETLRLAATASGEVK